MKLFIASFLALAVVNDVDALKKRTRKPRSPKANFTRPNVHYMDHYLVGLLNLPQSYVDPKLQNHTSGKLLNGNGGAPWNSIPSVGFSDIEFAYTNGKIVRGEYFCLSDNGYGSPANSEDYALNIARVKIQKPFAFRHGGITFEPYTPAINLNSAIIHDPNGLIKWENGADIQVAYAIPDSTWNDYRQMRVLTGRDFDPEGLAVINENFALIGDELMPAIFAVNPTTGVVLSPFVRTPDIDADGNFIPGKFLSTRGDKVHCNITALQANSCKIVDSSVVTASKYRKHDPSGGYEGFSVLADGTVAAFLEKTSGDSTLGNEPGVRVYKVLPGNGTLASPPKFDSFMGFYPFEIHGGNIADVSAIPGSSRYVVVMERNGFPSGSHMWPINILPHNYLCIVDLLDLDDDMVMRKKKCILNYQRIDDPWDVDGNGIFRYAQIQQTNEQVIVVDDNCIIAGTDTNYPGFNDFNLNMTNVPYAQQVIDARWMVLCFQEPIFNLAYPHF
jgi:hypothetical protein